MDIYSVLLSLSTILNSKHVIYITPDMIMDIWFSFILLIQYPKQ